MQQMTWYLIT